MRISDWSSDVCSSDLYGPLLRACGFAEIINAAEVTGTATGGATGTITLAASSSSDNDEYNGMVLTIASGLGAGQTRRVQAYVGSSKTVTVATACDPPPDNTHGSRDQNNPGSGKLVYEQVHP